MLPSNKDEYAFALEPNQERDLLEREERCQKAIKAVTKAIAMRLIICSLLVWIVVQTAMQTWVIGLMLLVLMINVTGILPLAAELKKRRLEWKELLKEECKTP